MDAAVTCGFYLAFSRRCCSGASPSRRARVKSSTSLAGFPHLPSLGHMRIDTGRGEVCAGGTPEVARGEVEVRQAMLDLGPGAADG